MAVKPTLTEDQVQKQIIEALQWSGYIVLETSRRRKGAKCPLCGTMNYASGGDGVSKGLPDLMVAHKSWPAFVWVGLEVKGPKTPVSPEQASLAADGKIFIVRSVEDAYEALKFVTPRITGGTFG